MKIVHTSLYSLIAVMIAFAGCSPSNGGNSEDMGSSPTFNPLSYVYQVPAVDPANFDNYPINNPYFPLVPGTTYEYESEEEGELTLEHFYVTYDTLEIAGVECTVVYDWEEVYVEDLDDWFLTEETYDYHAQDVDGNVWYFGEDTVAYLYDDSWNYEGTSTEGSWRAGVDDATAGIVMLASPSPGVSYQQEYLEGEAEDMAKVLRLNARVSIDHDDFDNCLVTKEWSKLEPGKIEHKYYAPGIGLVYVEELKGKTVKVELVDMY